MDLFERVWQVYDHYVHFESMRTGMSTRDMYWGPVWERGTSLRIIMCISGVLGPGWELMISLVSDYYMYFNSTGIEMRTQDKFKDCRWNLLFHKAPPKASNSMIRQYRKPWWIEPNNYIFILIVDWLFELLLSYLCADSLATLALEVRVIQQYNF